MNETPQANRIHIAFFGLRNAGKSTLVNAFTGQNLAIVSDTPGTTTDPVSKAMEILPLGPCLVTDTAGLDDVGELGAQRVAKTFAVLATTDVAVWVGDAGDAYGQFLAECRRRNVTVLQFRRGDSVAALKEKIANLKLVDETPALLDGIVQPGDRVICVCPIDESAPKGRLILPQVQVIRDCLDRHVACTVCQPGELSGCLNRGAPESGERTVVITDSQAFGEVSEILEDTRREARDASERRETRDVKLTSFSILFARQKGDLDSYVRGLTALKSLKDGDTVLVAEGCTHHRQCNDIGTTKIPKALEKLTGRKLKFVFASGNDFLGSRTRDARRETRDAHSNIPTFQHSNISLIVHCGGCMLTRREVLRRIGVARDAGIPIVNYGMLLAAANGIEIRPDCRCLSSSTSRLASRDSRPGEGVSRET